MSDEQRRNRRTDLPHDQVANDNDGQAYNEPVDFESYVESLAPETDNVENRNNRSLVEDEQHNEETAEEITPLAGANPLLGGEDAAENEEHNFREETAAEVTPDRIGAGGQEPQNVEETEETEGGGTALGWTALVLSILSLFFLPVLMATAGIVTGFFAYRGGAKSLGLWGIGLGLFSLLLSLFFVPLVVG